MFPVMGSAGKALPPPSLELDREIGLFYTIEEGAAVLGLVRFLAQIVPKCFT
jgi:hypothetical protein